MQREENLKTTANDFCAVIKSTESAVAVPSPFHFVSAMMNFLLSL